MFELKNLIKKELNMGESVKSAGLVIKEITDKAFDNVRRKNPDVKNDELALEIDYNNLLKLRKELKNLITSSIQAVKQIRESMMVTKNERARQILLHDKKLKELLENVEKLIKKTAEKADDILKSHSVVKKNPETGKTEIFPFTTKIIIKNKPFKTNNEKLKDLPYEVEFYKLVTIKDPKTGKHKQTYVKIDLEKFNVTTKAILDELTVYITLYDLYVKLITDFRNNVEMYINSISARVKELETIIDNALKKEKVDKEIKDTDPETVEENKTKKESNDDE